MLKLYLRTVDGDIDMGETYDSLQDAKEDYPDRVFYLWRDKKGLVVEVKTERKPDNEPMRTPGKGGVYY